MIFWALSVPYQLLQNTKMKTLLVKSIKNTKLDSRNSCSGKRLADWRKTWKRTMSNRKTKIVKENRFKELERIIEGSDTERFSLLHEWILGSQKCYPQSKSWGEDEMSMREGKANVFVFSCSRKFKKTFFPKMVLFLFRNYAPLFQSPTPLSLGKSFPHLI